MRIIAYCHKTLFEVLTLVLHSDLSNNFSNYSVLHTSKCKKYNLSIYKLILPKIHEVYLLLDWHHKHKS